MSLNALNALRARVKPMLASPPTKVVVMLMTRLMRTKKSL